MSVHDRMESLADVHAAGGLTDGERRDVDAHAAACAACAAILRDAREFSRWAHGALAPDAPPADLEDRILARFNAENRAPVRRAKLLWLRRALQAAASVAAVVGLVVIGGAFTDSRGATALLEGIASVEQDFSVHPPGTAEGKSLFYGLADKDGLKRERLGRQNETADRAEEVRALGANAGPGESGKGKKAQLAEVDANTSADTEPEGLVAGKVKTQAPVQDNRKIIRNADVRIEVESYDAASAKINELVAAEKGSIAGASTQRMANGKMQATITLRIPPDRFEAVLAKFREIGTVRHQNIRSEDVTKQYVDLESRLKSKETLAERLRKILAEGKGTMKELMEVEVQLGATLEAVEQIKGEIKYYDNLVGMSTIVLHVAEKDLGQPFEYVQTLQSTIGVTARDPDAAYAKAQKEVADAGGQVVDSRMTRQNDGAAEGTIKARVDSEKFPALRDALKKLGHVTQDTVNQQKTARGGSESARTDAPIRKEQAIVTLTISSPPLFVTRRAQVHVEAGGVEGAYQAARQAVEAAGGKIVDGSLTGRNDGATATVHAQIEAEKFSAVVERLKALGKVKNATVQHIQPALTPEGGPPLLRERGEIELTLTSPPELIGEEHGLVKSLRDTLAHSWAGILWSIEKLFVGLALAGPWLAIGIAAWVLYKRAKRRKAANPARPIGTQP